MVGPLPLEGLEEALDLARQALRTGMGTEIHLERDGALTSAPDVGRLTDGLEV